MAKRAGLGDDSVGALVPLPQHAGSDPSLEFPRDLGLVLDTRGGEQGGRRGVAKALGRRPEWLAMPWLTQVAAYEAPVIHACVLL